MKGFEDNPNVVLRALDVTNTENVNAVVEEIIEKEGRIDIVSISATVLVPLVILMLRKLSGRQQCWRTRYKCVHNPVVETYLLTTRAQVLSSTWTWTKSRTYTIPTLSLSSEWPKLSSLIWPRGKVVSS